jgi:predicted metalloendopeptidase
VNGQVSLISDWYELFDVREGQKLYVAPEKRFYIW